MYLFDEPTTGLHFVDIAKLLEVLFKLRDAGNTLIVIEHNLEVIKCADWVIDLGPEGGAGGGRIIGAGTPEQIARLPESYTGHIWRGSYERAQRIPGRALVPKLQLGNALGWAVPAALAARLPERSWSLARKCVPK